MIVIETLSVNRTDFKGDLLCLFSSPLFPNHARKTKPTPKTLRQKKSVMIWRKTWSEWAHQVHISVTFAKEWSVTINCVLIDHLYPFKKHPEGCFFLPGCDVAFIHRAPGLLCSSSSLKHQSEGLFFGVSQKLFSNHSAVPFQNKRKDVS